ncbi:hypothetical protein D3C81_2176370 [compost metagenome]
MDGLHQFDSAHQHHDAITPQQHQVRVDVVAAGNGVEDKVEAIGGCQHRRLIVGQQHVTGAQGAGVIGLAW